jgi:hypothetical protein
MTRILFAIFIAILLPCKFAFAQDGVAWVQIEAQPSLAKAQARTRAYAAKLPDVNGFALSGGWYAVVLGPYTAGDAQRVLSAYRADRLIPSDSFIAYSSSFRQQFWPVGANLLNLPAVAAPQSVEPQTTEPQSTEPQATDPQVQTAPQPEPQASDETPTEARRSEAELSRDERKQLQVMLKWAGVYPGAIDGAFGRGTRGSMAAWQDANGYEKTGILTTAQRADLTTQYNKVLDGLGLQVVDDTTAGIEMKIPTDVVAFTKYVPPFAHFDATGDIAAKVLLISQKGDQNTLYGLYDIMQTLEIVPETGPRERNKNSFVLTGENADIVSHTEASLEDGVIKGFTLVWPAGDEERRTRLLGEMQQSFRRLDAVLDPAAGANEAQDIDLVSGLEIRKPKLSRSGFYVDQAGSIITTAKAVAECKKITVEDEYEANVVFSDPSRNIAVLRTTEPLAPATIAALRDGAPRLQSDVAVSGYSYEGALDAPTLTFGKLSDVRGLNGEKDLKRLALNALPGDVGGPVFADDGAVMGMLLPNDDKGRELPKDVSFAMDADAIRAVLSEAGISASTPVMSGPMAPEDLARNARDMTVLVSCW